MVVSACTKSLNKQGVQIECVPEFPRYMNTCVLAEGRNFTTFSRENYAIALGGCYLFTKKLLNMEL